MGLPPFDLIAQHVGGGGSGLTPLLLLGALVFLAGMWAIPQLRRRRAMSKFPLLGAEYGTALAREKAFRDGAMGIYAEGYRKFRNVVHRLTTSDGEMIVVPAEYLDEMRKLPDDQINNWRPFYTILESRYTGVISPERDEFVARMVRSDLTRNLARINPLISAEVDQTVKRLLPQSESWTSVGIENALLEIVATVSGRIFIGPELCKREEWLDASINYTVNVFQAVRALKSWSRWSRPIGRFFTPELKRIDKHRADAKAFLLPILRDRRGRMMRGEPVPEDDMLQWMLTKGVDQGVKEEEIAVHQLGLSMAAIHTTTRTVTQILFDLVAYPEVIPDLRKEIETVLAEHDGVMTSQALFHMKLLDSTMKESHRMNPAGLDRFVRAVMKDVTLKDGTHFPGGSTIEVPYGPITRDQTLFHKANTFDPYRFYRIRTGGDAPPSGLDAKTNKEQFQFVSVTETDMGFGFGRHACPGRFFAANEIKLILARILLEYDISLPEGVTERYKNIAMGSSSIPPRGAVIRMRRLRKEV